MISLGGRTRYFPLRHRIDQSTARIRAAERVETRVVRLHEPEGGQGLDRGYAHRLGDVETGLPRLLKGDAVPSSQFGDTAQTRIRCPAVLPVGHPAGEGFHGIGDFDIRYLPDVRAVPPGADIFRHGHAQQSQEDLLAEPDTAQPGHGQIIESPHGRGNPETARPAQGRKRFGPEQAPHIRHRAPHCVTGDDTILFYATTLPT